MKRMVFLCVILAVTLFAVDARALDVAEISKGLSVAGFSAAAIQEMSKIPNKPHFLLGLERKYTKWDQFQELRKIFLTVGRYYEPAGSTIIDRKASGYSVDTTLQETISVEGKKVQIVYLGYHETNGFTVIWTKLGEKNLSEFSPIYEKYKAKWALGAINDPQWSLVQKLMGWAQFEAVKNYIHNTVSEAARQNSVFYKSFNFVGRIVEQRAKTLGDPDYVKRTGDRVNNSDLKVNDIIPMPRVEVIDFLPDIFFVGIGKFDGGLAYWKVDGSERITYVGIRMLMVDYINGTHNVTKHEFTHTNASLQSFPYGLYLDMETWAEMSTGFLEADVLDYLFHPYYAHWRDLAKIYFGYDADEVRRRIFPGELSHIGVRDINKEQFEINAKNVETIAGELRKFVEDLLVDFYVDPLFWTAVNTKFCDTAAALRIRFALKYEPAGIFDPDKKDKDGKVVPPSVQTKSWLLREEESGKLDRLAEYAMKKTGTKSDVNNNKEMSKFSDSSDIKCPVNSTVFLVSKQEREEIYDTLNLLIQQAKAGDVVARNMLLRIFGREVAK